MLHGKLNHLPDPLNLGPKAPHILVGGAGGFHRADALDRLFQEHNIRLLADDHHISGMGLRDHQGDRLHPSHEGMGPGAHDGQDVASHHRPLQGLAADHVCGIVSIVHIGAGGRGQDDLLGVGEASLADLDPVAYAHAGILADEAVNPDIVLGPVLAIGSPDLGCGHPLALDLDDVSGREAQCQERIGVQAGYAPGGVIGIGLGHLEVNILHFPHNLALFCGKQYKFIRSPLRF